VSVQSYFYAASCEKVDQLSFEIMSFYISLMRGTSAEEKSSHITLSVYKLTLHSVALLDHIPEIKNILIFCSITSSSGLSLYIFEF
jgi:hypothetical protein